MRNCTIDTADQNVVGVTTSGSGSSRLTGCDLVCGTASCISVGTGSSMIAMNNNITSTNTNVFTGLGTIATGGNVCTNSSGNNVSVSSNLTTI